MTLGIVTAMEAEIENLLKCFETKNIKIISNIRYYIGLLNKVSCVLAICGIGKVNSAICAQTMALKFSVDFILNIGLAGASNKKLSIGDIVIAENVVQHDVDTSPLGDPVGMVSTINLINIPCNKNLSNKALNFISKKYINNVLLGTIASADKFVCSKVELNKIKERFGAIAVDMEAGSIAQVCYLNNVKFICVKIISDSVFKGEKDFVKDYKSSKIILTKKLCEIVYELLPELVNN